MDPTRLSRPAPLRPLRQAPPRLAGTALAIALLAACAGQGTRPEPLPLAAGFQLGTHRDGDDLLTAGLGEAGLRNPVPPPFADPAAPTAAELRRRAVWTNWRGIADLAPGGGYGEVYGALAPVPGREYHALVRAPGARQPHRVMVQVPDGFDPARRCVVVTASSGSRGIYGAIALAGAWGLPRGCAVAYTDKGAGTGFVDLADGRGTALSGRPAGDGELVEFRVPPASGDGVMPVATKHAHSGDNPEAAWGAHVRQAARVALQVLELAHPEAGPWRFEDTRVVAVGVSNGAGAVLRAAETDGSELDAVVAISPNVHAAGGRALYDYTTEAALWMPCALTAPAFDGVALARPAGQPHPAGTARCASLAAAGLLGASEPRERAAEAHARLAAAGWTDEALAAGALSTGFDLWRAVAVTYASAYARTPAEAMPCGFRFHALGADGRPRAPSAVERAAWWSDGSGIPPGAGVGLFDPGAAGADPAFAGLRCLRAAWDDAAGAVRAGIAETRAAPPRAGLPVIVIHGLDDGLVPEAFSSAPWVRQAEAAGRGVSYWRVRHAQHFDAFLGLPVLGMRYVPLLPYGYSALDAAWSHLSRGTPLPGDAEIVPVPRAFVDGALAPLRAENLGTLP